jgi:hypothetical protein
MALFQDFCAVKNVVLECGDVSPLFFDGIAMRQSKAD